MKTSCEAKCGTGYVVSECCESGYIDFLCIAHISGRIWNQNRFQIRTDKK